VDSQVSPSTKAIRQKVARTIADLAAEAQISAPHDAEALGLNRLDCKLTPGGLAQRAL
jgi:predicted ATPase with chaperone activity